MILVENTDEEELDMGSCGASAKREKQVFFTSDIHFGHANIIKFCERPFDNAREMNDEIVRRWNEKVMSGDDVFILGDVGLMRTKDLCTILDRLNGNLHLIAGNHDRKHRRSGSFKKKFNWIKDLYTLKIKDPDAVMGIQRIELCHYAMRTWNKVGYGSWMLYGHSHGTLPDDPRALSIDVGMDCHDFVPISYEDVKAIMAKKLWKPPFG